MEGRLPGLRRSCAGTLFPAGALPEKISAPVRSRTDRAPRPDAGKNLIAEMIFHRKRSLPRRMIAPGSVHDVLFRRMYVPAARRRRPYPLCRIVSGREHHQSIRGSPCAFSSFSSLCLSSCPRQPGPVTILCPGMKARPAPFRKNASRAWKRLRLWTRAGALRDRARKRKRTPRAGETPEAGSAGLAEVCQRIRSGGVLGIRGGGNCVPQYGFGPEAEPLDGAYSVSAHREPRPGRGNGAVNAPGVRGCTFFFRAFPLSFSGSGRGPCSCAASEILHLKQQFSFLYTASCSDRYQHRVLPSARCLRISAPI